MTAAEIIDKLNKLQRDTPLEFDLADGNKIKIEYTLTNEYIVNYFDHQHILKSEVYPTEAQFVLFMKGLLDNKQM